jgi:glyoxylase-like metal-dependent hydrolase (beta-lactamase superfamily II)
MQNFVYLLEDEKSKEAMAIDSGWETGPIVKAAEKEGMHVKYVVATHGHYDHVETLTELAHALGAKTVAHEASELKADVKVKDGDTLALGKTTVRVIHTPGHTPDSISLYDGENLFTGDTLFIGNCGRTDLPGGSPAQLFHSLHDVLSKLPPSTLVYPGHDYGDVPSRALGVEAKTNPTLLAKNLKEFTGVE